LLSHDAYGITQNVKQSDVVRGNIASDASCA